MRYQRAARVRNYRIVKDAGSLLAGIERLEHEGKWYEWL
jgi:hypothetical protein